MAVTKKYKKTTKEGWNFWCFGLSSSIIIADSKLPYYNEEKFEETRKQLKKEGCKFYYDKQEKDKCGHKHPRYTKTQTRVEIYHKCETEDFDEMVEELMKIINKIAWD